MGDQRKEEVPNFYGMLNVSRDANTQEIIDAYRQVSKKFEDAEVLNNISEADLEYEYAMCLEAFRTLSDQESRAKYDEQLAEYEELVPLNTQNTESVEIINDESEEMTKMTSLFHSLSEMKLDVEKAKERQAKKEHETFIRAKVYLSEKKYHEAIDLFRKLIEMNSKQSIYHSYLGMTLVEKGWHGYAEAEFKVALHYNPLDEIALEYLHNKDKIKIEDEPEQNSGFLNKVTQLYTKFLPKSQKM